MNGNEKKRSVEKPRVVRVGSAGTKHGRGRMTLQEAQKFSGALLNMIFAPSEKEAEEGKEKKSD